MATSFTPNLNLGKPGIYPPGDLGWDVEWNSNADKLDTLINKFWSETSTRLRMINQTLTYDIASNVIASPLYLDIGSVAPPDNKRVDMIRLVGTLTGAPTDPNTKELFGFVFNLTNAATTGLNPSDNTQVRGVIGTVSLDGPGSGRGIHVTASATANATATTAGSAGAFTVIATSAMTPGLLKALQLSENSGLSGITDGLQLSVSAGSKFRYGVTIAGDMCSNAGIFLATNTNAGKIQWSGTDYLWSPALGSLEFVGVDAAAHLLRVVCANANTQDKGIIFRSRRGTVAAPTAVAASDAMVNYYAQGYDGASEITAAYITAIVDGAVTAGDVPGRFEVFTRQAGTLASRIKIATGLQVGAPSGGDKGAGSANFAADIYKNNIAFTNPRWALQHYYTGQVDPDGDYAPPAPYLGLQSLERVEEFTRTHYDLPLMRMVPGGGIFARGDLVLASLEEAYLYLFQLHHRMQKLERDHSEH